MNNWDVLAQEIFDIIWEETKELWEDSDNSFLMGFVQDLAREKWLVHYGDPLEIEIHKNNLEHLLVTLEGELLRKRIAIKREAIPILIKILRVVVQVMILTRLAVTNAKTN